MYKLYHLDVTPFSPYEAYFDTAQLISHLRFFICRYVKDILTPKQLALKVSGYLSATKIVSK